jgi:hypothetical protein
VRFTNHETALKYVTRPAYCRGTSDKDRSPLDKKIADLLTNLTQLLRLKSHVIHRGEVMQQECHVAGRKFIEVTLPCRLRARDRIASIHRPARVVKVRNLAAAPALSPQETNIMDGFVRWE